MRLKNKMVHNHLKRIAIKKMEITQKQYEEWVHAELENFILWFWSDDEDRKQPLEALEEYNKIGNYNELD